nr:hypothetical protein [uncultured Nitrososphaera sp.]
MICDWPECGKTAYFELEITHCGDEDGSDAIDAVFCERHYAKAKSYGGC